MRIALITPSFSRDHDLCVELCRSIDEYDRDSLEHVVIVPREDVAMFRHLHAGRRRVMAQETILPAWLVRVPLPTVVGVAGIWRKRLRKIWVTPSGRVVRGWVLQQVLKLSADRATDADGYVFIDSDAVMIREFGTSTFVRDSQLPLICAPGPVDYDLERYTRWQNVACDLIGIERFPFAGDYYIAAVVCWRRDRLKELQERIDIAAHRDVQATLLRQRHLSEYIVYGIFCQHAILGDSGHYVLEQSLCHEDWNYDMTSEAGLQAFVGGLEDRHVAVLIQSTSEWPVERRRETVAAIRRAAALA